MKKILSNIILYALLMIEVLCVALTTGCGQEPFTVTSEDAGLYLLGDKVVGYNGEEVMSNGYPMYGVSKVGDIVSLNDNKTVVCAANTKKFTCVSEIRVNKKCLEMKMPVIHLTTKEMYCEPVTWTVEIDANTSDSINKSIIVKSADTFTLYIDKKLECINADADDNNKIKFNVTACCLGESKLKICDVLGNEIDTLTITVTEDTIKEKNSISEIEEAIENCDHDFVDKIVHARDKSQEYTVHRCVNCGYLKMTD